MVGVEREHEPKLRQSLLARCAQHDAPVDGLVRRARFDSLTDAQRRRQRPVANLPRRIAHVPRAESERIRAGGATIRPERAAAPRPVYADTSGRRLLRRGQDDGGHGADRRRFGARPASCRASRSAPTTSTPATTRRPPGRPVAQARQRLVPPELVAPLVRHVSAGRRPRVVEGVMGMFDGAPGRGGRVDR